MDLGDCPAGMPLIVTGVTGDGAIASRLREIGMVPGSHIRVVRRGSPMIVEIGHSRFCLRGNEASLVRVRAAAHASEAAPQLFPVESPGP